MHSNKSPIASATQECSVNNKENPIFSLIKRDIAEIHLEEYLFILENENFLQFTEETHQGERLGHILAQKFVASFELLYKHLFQVKCYLTIAIRNIDEAASNNKQRTLDGELALLRRFITLIEEIMQLQREILLGNYYEKLGEIVFVSGKFRYNRMISLQRKLPKAIASSDLPRIYLELNFNDHIKALHDYTCFVELFEGNFMVNIAKLKLIFEKFSFITSFCPVERRCIVYDICSMLHTNDMQQIAPDLRQALLRVTQDSKMFFHSLFLQSRLRSRHKKNPLINYGNIDDKIHNLRVILSNKTLNSISIYESVENLADILVFIDAAKEKERGEKHKKLWWEINSAVAPLLQRNITVGDLQLRIGNFIDFLQHGKKIEQTAPQLKQNNFYDHNVSSYLAVFAASQAAGGIVAPSTEAGAGNAKKPFYLGGRGL